VLFAAPLIFCKAKPRAWLIAIATVAAFYLPFLAKGATDLNGLGAFGAGWEFNSLGFVLLHFIFGDKARLAGLVLYAGFCGFVCLRRREWLRGDLLLGVFFFLAPVINPWYLVLIAPFVAIRPTITGIAALTAVFLSYATMGNLGQPGPLFDHPAWVRFTEAGIIMAAVLSDLYRSRSGGRDRNP
jgi:hypothetical protein